MVIYDQTDIMTVCAIHAHARGVSRFRRSAVVSELEEKGA